MAEDENELEEFDFEEWKRKNKERRKERQKHASYEWVETVREAGERYRHLERIEAVSEELGLSKKTTQEALTVYRLIFEEPPGKISTRTSATGRAFFSLNEDIDRIVDEESAEELLREIVGAIYLEHNVDEQPVGSPPERSTPPLLLKFDKLTGNLFENYSSPMQSFITGSTVSAFQNAFEKSQKRMIANAMQPVINQQNRMAARIGKSVAAQQKEMMQSVISTSFPPIVRQLQRNLDLVNTSIVNSVIPIHFPQSVLADVASIQPGFSAAVATGAASTSASYTPTSANQSTVTESSATTVEPEPTEVDDKEIHSANPVPVTLDSTLPSQDTISTELVFEIPGLMVQTILSAPEVRVWFGDLHEDYQIDLVKVLLALSAFALTGNPATMSIAAIPAQSIRRVILGEEEDDE